MVRVGLVGCGTIGARVALALQRNYRRHARLVALHDIIPAQALALARRLHPRPRLVSLPELIRTSDVVIEAASAGAAGEVVTRALRANRIVFVMSVGGLLRNSSWKRAVPRSSGKVYIPSGALAGLDGVKAMAVGRLRRIWLTTRKPPRALASAPYVRRRGLRLDRLTRPTLLFEGSPRAVVSAFPQNTNVAAALALAAGGSARTTIRVIADPAIRMNTHELDILGDSGRITCRIASRPSDNPKTSELAVRSAVAALGRLFDTVLVGT
jgi:aspartate dehydrogenase